MISHTHDYAINQQRRRTLCQYIQKKYGQKGKILLCAHFEQEARSFVQDASFWYFTGIMEPGATLTIDVETGFTTVWVPNFGTERAKWVADALVPSEKLAQLLLVDRIEYLGNQCRGYQWHPFFSASEYHNLLKQLEGDLEQYTIYSLNPEHSYTYIDQRLLLQRISRLLPHFEQKVVDISGVVAQMRRSKSQEEVGLIYQAIEITQQAYEMAASLIKPGVYECEVQAALEYGFTAAGAQLAFPSIVAGGKNGTILHYTANNAVLKKGELVVIDSGARYQNYCADITRTFPISGNFSTEQEKLYNIVLETQEHVARLAKPGMWLSYKAQPEASLHHQAQEFLRQKGYEQYFIHGIGHFLGLEVHDVGDYTVPLMAGDIITIEPGIYIPEQQCGIRIEDNYLITQTGAVCLSDALPKHTVGITSMMQNS